MWIAVVLMLSMSLASHRSVATSVSGKIKSCSSKFVVSEKSDGAVRPAICSELGAAGKIFYRRFDDGTMLPSPHLLQKLSEPSASTDSQSLQKQKNELVRLLKASPAQLRALKKLTSDLKALYLSSVSNSVNSERLRKRIQNLTFDFSGTSCSDVQPDAKYLMDSNTVSVCKSIQNYPLETLIPIIAHEIAHATDPCQFDELQFDRKKAKTIDSGNYELLRECGLKGDIAVNLLQRIKAVNQSGETTILPDSDFAWVYYSCGLANSTSVAKVDSPWASIAVCSNKIDRSTSLRSNTIPEMVEFESKMLGANSYTGRPRIPPTPTSGQLSCNSMARESYADHVGAGIAAKYLADHFKAEGGRPNLLWYLNYINCFRPANAGASYPEPALRIGAFLQYPEIQNAVGCHDEEIKSFCPYSNGTDYRPKKSSPVVQ